MTEVAGMSLRDINSVFVVSPACTKYSTREHFIDEML